LTTDEGSKAFLRQLLIEEEQAQRSAVAAPKDDSAEPTL
jgi:hypothetical protein